jgi:ribulose-5-phosphate 4-epimerase/fuculose-1-phosphate aldolase
MSGLIDALREIVIANRILAAEDVVDAFGHISVRHPDNPDHYLLARSRSPELVTMDDIMEFTLQGDIVGDDNRKPYAERHIHGGIYERRPDVQSVVHNHAQSLIPFSIAKTPLRPVMHVTGVIGEHVPVWDIEDKFGGTSLLVTNMDQARDLAEKMGPARVVLMRGHGCAIAADGIKEAVLTAVYTQVNAKLQLQAMPLGDVKYLSQEEIELTPETLIGPLAKERAWEYFARRAMGDEF